MDIKKEPIMMKLNFLKIIIAVVSLLATASAQEPPLQTIIFDESDEIFANPERGFYRYTYLHSLVAVPKLPAGSSLIWGKIVANAYREKDFTDTFLNSLQQGFNAVRNGGMKIIVRVSYADDIGQPDASKEQIFRHIDQLQPLFELNKDVICLAEAGFIGAWGEWHSSTHGLDTPQNRRDILFKLLSALPKERMTVIRTPHYKREIFKDSVLTAERAFDGSKLARTGFHNDCFLSSSNDVGTYIYKSRAQEIAYIGAETRFTPFGGETCSPYTYTACDHAIQEMELLHCTYLNDGWHPDVLNQWKDEGCIDEIKRRLGYRFVLRHVELSEKMRPGGILTFNSDVENVGFAAPFNHRLVELVLQNNRTQTERRATISVDPRYWLPGDTLSIERKFRIPIAWTHDEYTMFLNLPDPESSLYDDPRYSIRFANMDTWDKDKGMNRITANFLIDTTASGSVDPTALEFFEISESVSVPASRNFQPAVYRLMNYPNPFNIGTEIYFTLPRTDSVKLVIYNLNGQEIQTLLDDVMPAGQHVVSWDGLSASGLLVSSGIYLVRMTTPSYSGDLRITYLK